MTVPEMFGCKVFDDRQMRARLSEEVYASLKETIDNGKKLDLSVANSVAQAMCAWATENGATHFTHWFQPMTGITAEKHDGFISPAPNGGVIMEFSGKELIQGEPDASSFPSGGLRATFEARGYTAWDPTSYAFIKGKTLCIPTAFASYGADALDKKTPLLRSMDRINHEAVRILHLLGKTDVTRVDATVGPEQEYFLIDKEVYDRRKDLKYTGRTLFGARSPKGQQLDDHYFGAIKQRVKAFMAELDEELWKLGIYAKTEHNEVAPAQHELAPIFTTVNIAADHNQLTMELMKRIARKHGMVCLLHEKPFKGVNGSGKHNNWSLSANTGENLLKPGKKPEENTQFLLFLTAVIQAVDEYQDLLRLSVATAGNDHRLGGDEAPPAVISMFLGDDLEAIVEAIINNEDYESQGKVVMNTGAEALPEIRKDTTDRNRTSPFAFTGNRFEFRMAGSSENVSCTNYVLNTAVAESLRVYADRLEPHAGQPDLHDALMELVIEELRAHSRIFFDGNGYGSAWMAEAKERGLCNFRSTPEAFIHYDDPKNIRLLKLHGILNEEEIEARKTIGLTEYAKIVNIEANTMLLITDKEIIPAAIRAGSDMAESISAKQALGLSVDHELKLLRRINDCVRALCANNEKIADSAAVRIEDPEQAGMHTYRNTIPLMEAERRLVDELELMIDKKYWPYPDYTDLLYYV